MTTTLRKIRPDLTVTIGCFEGRRIGCPVPGSPARKFPVALETFYWTAATSPTGSHMTCHFLFASEN